MIYSSFFHFLITKQQKSRKKPIIFLNPPHIVEIMNYSSAVLDCLFDDDDFIDNFIQCLIEESACQCSHQHILNASDHPLSPDHCSLPQGKHYMFNHPCAKRSILSDYLGLNLLLGKKFDLMFCISCPRFKKLILCHI